MSQELMPFVEKVLKEKPETRETKNSWLFLSEVLRAMGFRIYIEFDGRMPSPETLFRERREILNRRNTYAKDFIPEPGVSYLKK